MVERLCDTLVALGNATENGNSIWGKNSDRPPNEAQVIRFVAQTEHEAGSEVRCSYIMIPQSTKTAAVFLSCPFWVWGAEMGANEHGVVIGNEAVFSKEEVPETGLLGMDLVRLGLERATSAKEALDVITSLLEEYGQGGVCELGGMMMYHNSFMIADQDEAWVLETSRQRWVAECVKNIRAISNGYTIHEHWDCGSDDIVEHAVKMGWYDEDEEFDFATVYGNEAMRYISRCDDRLQCSNGYLLEMEGEMNWEKMAMILRHHPDDWTPWNQEVAAICQHASHDNGYSATGSQISELGNQQTHWFTAAANPCSAVYWPFGFDSPEVYEAFSVGGETFSQESYWWRRESAKRELSLSFASSRESVRQTISEYQGRIRAEFKKSRGASAMHEIVPEHENALDTLLANLKDIDVEVEEYLDYWDARNAEARIPASNR